MHHKLSLGYIIHPYNLCLDTDPHKGKRDFVISLDEVREIALGAFYRNKTDLKRIKLKLKIDRTPFQSPSRRRKMTITSFGKLTNLTIVLDR